MVTGASNGDSVGREVYEDNEQLRRVIRFSVPHNAKLILLLPYGAIVPEIPGYTVWSLPVVQKPDLSLLDLDIDNELIATCTTLVAQGGAFLVVPHAVFSWLTKRPQLYNHLEQHYRLVVHEAHVCTIFALQEPPDQAWRDQGAPDNLPLPPPELIALVTGMPQVQPFYWSGLLGARCIRGLLNKNGVVVDQCRAILDFGCGCGRIMRHWNTLAGPELFGTDYNPYLVHWCQTALPFASFSTNTLTPPLAYVNEQFDLIYTISIFTHLEEPLQIAWMQELTRLLRPGGLLFLTVHGSTHLHRLSEEQQRNFRAGKLVFSQPELSGSNHCATYHPEAYVRKVLAKDLRIIDFVPGGAKDANQDVFLLQKP
ncbi:MAG: class I SAM-dependent methyltransferase [Candidatus Binatia bacterium]